MISFFNSVVRKIKKKIVNILLGKEYYDAMQKIETNSSQIELMSTLVGEQSRLIVSIALIQNDMAKSISGSESLEEILEMGDSCFVVKIPLSDDEFLN